MKITRQQLYLWVWSTPQTQIADVLNKSQTWLYNKLRTYEIPPPPRGYWRKLQCGIPVQQAPLTHPADIRLTDIEVTDKEFKALEAAASSTGAAFFVTPSAVGRDIPEALEARTCTQEAGSAVALDAETVAQARETSLEMRSEFPQLQQSHWAGLSPVNERDLRALLKSFELCQTLQVLLQELEDAHGELDPRARALTALWRASAEQTLSNIDPVRRINAACRNATAASWAVPWEPPAIPE